MFCSKTRLTTKTAHTLRGRCFRVPGAAVLLLPKSSSKLSSHSLTLTGTGTSLIHSLALAPSIHCPKVTTPTSWSSHLLFGGCGQGNESCFIIIISALASQQYLRPSIMPSTSGLVHWSFRNLPFLVSFFFSRTLATGTQGMLSAFPSVTSCVGLSPRLHLSADVL